MQSRDECKRSAWQQQIEAVIATVNEEMRSGCSGEVQVKLENGRVTRLVRVRNEKIGLFLNDT